MSINSPRETLESLRITVARLEQSTDLSTDPQGAAELKRILLARIADLEVLAALEAQSPEPSSKPDDSPVNSVAALPPLEIVAAEEPAEEAAKTPPPAVPPSDLE
jgi:hypothetical protein